MLKVMFLCTANSCRSQMAEGLANTLGKGLIEAYSAGMMPFDFVQPKAILVMKEIGIDISNNKPKLIDPELLSRMDVVITLCDDANDVCPRVPPDIKRLHWSIKDPVRTIGSEKVILNEFRRARDEIKEKILKFIKDNQQK